MIYIKPFQYIKKPYQFPLLCTDIPNPIGQIAYKDGE